MSVHSNLQRRGRSRVFPQVTMAAVLSLLVVAVTVLPAQAGLQSAADVNLAGGGNPVVAADLNGDGKIDLVTVSPNSVVMVLNNGNGTFGSPQIVASTGNYPVAIAVADLNGDGKPDLVTGNVLDNTVSVSLGNGNGTFQAKADFPTDPFPSGVAIADLNGDHKLDLVTFNAIVPSVSVLLGNGDGTFAARVDYAAGSTFTDLVHHPIAVADVTGDGKLDIVVAAPSLIGVHILPGNGDGTFQPVQLVLTGVQLNSVVVADLNGDGKLDFLGSIQSQNFIAVSLGNGDGTFVTLSQVFPTAAQPLGLTVADLNGDGKPDVAVATRNGKSLSVLLGDGDGTFEPRTDFASSDNLTWATAADLNGDGRPDIAAASFPLTKVFLNDGPTVLQFANASANVPEGSGTVVVNLTRTSSASGSVSARVSLIGGSATQG